MRRSVYTFQKSKCFFVGIRSWVWFSCRHPRCFDILRQWGELAVFFTNPKSILMACISPPLPCSNFFENISWTCQKDALVSICLFLSKIHFQFTLNMSGHTIASLRYLKFLLISKRELQCAALRLFSAPVYWRNEKLVIFLFKTLLVHILRLGYRYLKHVHKYHSQD